MDLHLYFAKDELEEAEYYTVCSNEQLLQKLDYYELIFSEEQLEVLDALRAQSEEENAFYKQMHRAEI